jgi:hypothetical protein
MKTNNSFRIIITVAFFIALVINSCVRKEEQMGDAGPTLVKFYPAGYSKVLLAPVASSQTVAIIEVRRDPARQASMNTSTSAVLKFDKDTAIIKQYNILNGTYYELLPDALYTSIPGIATDGTLTVNIDAGEFVKSIMITVPNVFNFDFSKKYALAYKIMSVSGTDSVSHSIPADTAIIEIGAQNAYEGWYHSMGFRDHPTAGIFTVDIDKYLSTINEYTVETYTGDYTGYRLWIAIDSNAVLANNVTVSSPDVMLYNNDPTVNARGIPGGYNHYDPLNKVFYLYYYYNSSAPRVIQETITKK